jgi:hypothetical protein
MVTAQIFLMLVMKKNRKLIKVFRNCVQIAWTVFALVYESSFKFDPIFLYLCVFESSSKQGPSLKLGPGIWDQVLNSVSASCCYIVHAAHFSFM